MDATMHISHYDHYKQAELRDPPFRTNAIRPDDGSFTSIEIESEGSEFALLVDDKRLDELERKLVGAIQRARRLRDEKPLVQTGAPVL